VHLSSATGRPQLAQNALPGTSGLLQFGQKPEPEARAVPQLTHFFALLSLSVPHFGHGLYSSPQKGQNRRFEANFLEQFEQ